MTHDSHAETKMTVQHASARRAVSPPHRATRLDLLLATLQREAAHDRIVRMFVASAFDRGPGPSEADLRSFAQLAVTEQRLARKLGCSVASHGREALVDEEAGSK
jgi:hypothetical protein